MATKPILSPNADIGMVVAIKVTKYAFTTQILRCGGIAKSLEMVGKARLAILESMTATAMARIIAVTAQ